MNIIRCKDIQQRFGVCLSTAKNWRKEVRSFLGLASNQPISITQWNTAATAIKPAWQIDPTGAN